MVAPRHKEEFEIDFLFCGNLQEYANNIDTKLRESLEEASNSVQDIEGRVFISSSRGKEHRLGGQRVHHGNITFNFEYSSEKPLSNLVSKYILPRIINRYISPYLNSDCCVELTDLHSGGYTRTRVLESTNMESAVIEGLKKMGREDISPDFVKTILDARPHDAP